MAIFRWPPFCYRNEYRRIRWPRTAVGKLILPDEVVAAELDQLIKKKVRATLTERILREAGLDRQVRDAVLAFSASLANS
jgi:hypothetical protein